MPAIASEETFFLDDLFDVDMTEQEETQLREWAEVSPVNHVGVGTQIQCLSAMTISLEPIPVQFNHMKSIINLVNSLPAGTEVDLNYPDPARAVERFSSS